MAINKVQYGSTTLIDLSTDTVSSSADILLGKIGHLRDGTVVTGTASGGDAHGTIWQDGEGYVHLDDESGISLQTKNATPTESQQVIEADTGYYALESVTVGAISSSYVGSGVTRRSSSDLSVSGATVTAPAGYYEASASKSVASGTAGTPTATKSAVSNHAVTVTPSVTNTAGYISGGTKTGTGVSVSASELVSGTYSVTSSGTKDVTNYASASVPAGTEGTPTATKGTVSNHSVSVTPSVTNTGGYIAGSTKTGTAVTVSASELVSGTKSITQNGTGIDVSTYASVDVNISSVFEVRMTVGGSDPNITLTPNATFAQAKAVLDAGGELRILDSNGNALQCTYQYYPSTNPPKIWLSYYRVRPNLDQFSYVYYYNWTSTGIAYIAHEVMVEEPTLITKNITANGTYNASSDSADGYSSVTVNVSGGGEEVSMDDPVRFFDYDGTLLHSYSASDFQALSAMPANPSHSGLTAQGWNWTLADAKAQVTAMGTCDIGQMYVTDDGKTRLYCHFEEGRLHPYLGICPNGTVIVDWGDNSATETLTGTSLTTCQTLDHEYVSEGDYIITLTVSSGTFQFYGASNTTYLLRKDGTNTTAYVNRPYSSSVQKIELGSGTHIGNYAFQFCTSLKSITIPNSTLTINQYAFSNCFALKHVSFPSGITNVASYSFNLCANLATISIPSTVTTIATSAFKYCRSLATISIPSGVTSLSTYAFDSCTSLKSVSIPSGVTTISQHAFSSCYSLKNIEMPNGQLTKIDSYAFQYCYSITDISIPSGVTTINNYAFSSCTSLTTISIPSGVTTLSGSVFATCNFLRSIALPSSITVIADSLFLNCHSLASIEIPIGITNIYAQSFQYCYGLGEIHFKPTTPPTVQNSNAWTNIPTDCKIYVPTGTLSDYTSATNYPSSSTYTYVEE